MGEFRKRSRLWTAQQAVTQAKQGIGSTLQAIISLLTKRLQCVKVYLETAPVGFFLHWNSTPSGNPLQEKIA
jgi:hypothetical protein